ncbi:MAG: GNAT family protein [Clostridiales bacterium]|nr:GNAT family protein [Clostridiales bacterium]
MEQLYMTKRLILKHLDETSAPYVLSFYQENQKLFEPWEPAHPARFYTLNYQMTLLAAERNLASRSQAIRYFLFEKQNPNKIIGTVNFYHMLRSPNSSCKLGYKLASGVWHQGYAYEAISFLLPIVFHSYRLHRIEAEVMPTNQRSIRLIKRLGFTYEGIARQSCEINGCFEDHCRFSLLKSECLLS